MSRCPRAVEELLLEIKGEAPPGASQDDAEGVQLGREWRKGIGCESRTLFETQCEVLGCLGSNRPAIAHHTPLHSAFSGYSCAARGILLGWAGVLCGSYNTIVFCRIESRPYLPVTRMCTHHICLGPSATHAESVGGIVPRRSCYLPRTARPVLTTLLPAGLRRQTAPPIQVS